MEARTKNQKYINPSNTAIVLVDHQPGVLHLVSSLPHEAVTTNVATLACLGEEMHLPLQITTTRENLGFLGTSLEAIQEAAPNAYEKRIRRAGTLNAFDDPAFVAAVKNLNRPNLVMAGLTTDVCLFHGVVSAIEAGYNVYVVADSSGSTSELADSVTYDRLCNLGAEITTTWGVLFELYSDLSTQEGQKAEKIVADSVAV